MQQPHLAVFFIASIDGLDQTVGEDDEPIRWSENDAGRFVLRFRLNAEGQSADVKALDQSVGAAQDRRVVSGIDVIKQSTVGVVLPKKRRGEAQSALAV